MSVKVSELQKQLKSAENLAEFRLLQLNEITDLLNASHRELATEIRRFNPIFKLWGREYGWRVV